MQKIHVIKDSNTKQIISLGYNPLKHEILAGCEDGTIKTWDCMGDNIGKLTRTCHEHNGWVNCFLYWSDQKLMLSAANDGKIIAWGSSMLPASVAKIGMPIYSMAWNVRRNQLILGLNASIRVYTLCDPMKEGKILADKAFIAKDHTDLVTGIVCYETRVYSAGYDRKICIYDSYAYPGKKGLKLVTCFSAHESGITILKLARDNENNTWLLTGAFDKTVKVWSQDGQLMHKFDGFSDTVSGLCYVPPTKTVWVAGGFPDAPMFDPKSGDNVSEFIGTFQDNKEDDKEKNSLVHLLFINDLNQVIATDTRRQITIWKHHPTGCITALRHKNAVECLTYTRKVPLLIFSGDSNGQIMKWERLQSNTFMYSKETLPRSEAVSQLASQLSDKYDWVATDKRHIKSQITSKKNKEDLKHQKQQSSNNEQENIAAMKLLFVEELDLLLVASEDNNIYVWGFDYKAVEVLQKMKPKEDTLTNKFAFLLKNNKDYSDTREKSTPVVSDNSVANRVAGFICKTVFTEHTQCVSGLAVIGKEAGFGSMFLVSASWDRRLLIWDLENLCLHDRFHHNNNNAKKGVEEDELAADGIITDLVYSSERNEIAYSSSDKLVYIREFSSNGSEMKLKAVLHGHEAEVTQVRWNPIHKKWITGSEDSTIRVWSVDGLTCDMVLSAHGSVTAMCIDTLNGCIVAGVQDAVRVYDVQTKSLVQINVGHGDVIRYLIHIPEREQYVSASWDKTVRVWNAFKKVTKRRDSVIL